MINIRKSEHRGQQNLDWLRSHHSFSFGHYYDPEQMGFSSLRVINDDFVQPGAGFASHGHRDMEIISYVIDGAIAHKDSAGHVKTLTAGEFQLMSAGKGIVHSEYNASSTEPLRFLQIWLEPETFGGQPGYQQKNFGQQQGLTTIATPTGEQGTFKLKQQAKVHQLLLAANSELDFTITSGAKVYVHVITGELTLDNIKLFDGDGAKVSEQNRLGFANNGTELTHALIFELAKTNTGEQ